MDENDKIYGLMAEFDTPEKLVSAARKAYAAGYREMDTYSPYPVEGLDEALRLGRTWISELVFLGGVTGALVAFGTQYYAAVFAYPLNVGGRPLNSWPAFIPITFELTILFAGIAAITFMLIFNRLPMPYHPVFNVPEFARASQDRFFIGIQANDRLFDREKTTAFLESLGPESVSAIPYETEEAVETDEPDED